jgi:hypothetical protein
MVSFPGLAFTEKIYFTESTHGNTMISWTTEKSSRPGWHRNICQVLKNYLWQTNNSQGLEPYQCFQNPPGARSSLVDFVSPAKIFRKFLNPKSWKSVLSATQEIRFQPFKEVMLINQLIKIFLTNLFVNPRKFLI